MTRMRAVVALIVVVLVVEIVLVMTDRATMHMVPGGVTVFAVLGAVVLVFGAKLLGAIGVQQAMRDTADDD
jgi:hypothetical protein